MAKSILVALIAIHLAGAAATQEIALDVSPTPAGSELSETLQRVRQLRADQPERAVVVRLASGTYWLDAPLVYEPEVSGTTDAPVRFVGVPGKTVVSGGREITGWTVLPDGRWQVHLPQVQAGSWNFTQIWVDGQRRYRPRLPRHGYFRIEERLPPSHGDAKRGDDRFRYSAASIPAAMANRDDVDLLVLHVWNMSRNRIADVSREARVVTFRLPTVSPSSWSSFRAGNRFLLENVKEALGRPGEWYLDRPTGMLTYVPVQGETPEQCHVVAPRQSYLVRFAGDVEKQRWVEHLSFEGITFSHSNWTTPEGGYHFPQAEASLGAAIAGVGARCISFINCKVAHTGDYAFEWGPGCRKNVIENCLLSDLGAGGVKLGTVIGSWSNSGLPDDSEAISGHHTIRDCTVVHGGRLHPAAVGVFIGHSPHNLVEGNEIADFYYSAVSVGWSWGYGRSLAHHNRILGNHMHHLGQGVLSDMGGVYTLGVSPGTVVAGNRIHDVDSYDYGGWGLYTDEGSTGIVMEKNVVFNAKSNSFHQHYGRDNQIRNNVLVNARQAQLARTRKEDHNSFKLSHNLVYWSTGDLFWGNWDGNYEMNHNLYWNAAGPVRFRGKTLEEWLEGGNDSHSMIADPGFANIKTGDFRLRDASPASAVGFNPVGMLLAPCDDVRLTAPAFPVRLDIDPARAAQLLDWLDLDRPGLERVKAASGSAILAMEELLDYYRRRTGVMHPVDRSRRLTARGRYATPDQLAAADRAVRHVFYSFSAYPPHFVGDDIDWASSPVPDREWLWHLHQQNFWGDLAHAYWHTGDEEYARAWCEQLVDWVHKNPRDRAHAYAWRPIETGIRGHAWTEHFEHFIDSPAFTPEVLLAFLSSAHVHAAYLMTRYSRTNHGLMEAEGLGFIGFFLPEFTASESWRNEAVRRLKAEIERQVRPDGHQREQCLNYHEGAITWFSRLSLLARLNGQGELFGDAYFARIERMCDVLLELSSPDGLSAQFGDTSSQENVRSALSPWADFFHREDYRYVASDGREGVKPASTAYALRDSGFYSMRSGWDANATCLVLKCGPDGGWHCQPDNGTFELWSGGRRLMPDSGTYIYDGDPESRRWFRQTAVHQTLTLDNGDTAYAARLRLWQPGDDLDTLVVENQSYPGLLHRRAVFFVHKRFFLLIDDAIGDATGDVRLHFQLAPGGVEYTKTSARTTYDKGTNLLIVTGPEELYDELWDNTARVDEEGQVSLHYGSRQPRPAFAFQWEKYNRESWRFATALVPYTGAVPAVHVVTLGWGGAGSSVMTARVEIDGRAFDVVCDLEQGRAWLR